MGTLIFHRQKTEKGKSPSSSSNKSPKHKKPNDDKKNKSGTSQRTRKGNLDVDLLVDKLEHIQSQPEGEPESEFPKTSKGKNKKIRSPTEGVDSKKVKAEVRVKDTEQKEKEDKVKEKKVTGNSLNTEKSLIVDYTEAQGKVNNKPSKPTGPQEKAQKIEKVNNSLSTTQQHNRPNKNDNQFENKKDIKPKTNPEQKGNVSKTNSVVANDNVKTQHEDKVVTSQKTLRENKPKTVDPKTQKEEKNIVAPRNTQKEDKPIQEQRDGKSKVAVTNETVKERETPLKAQPTQKATKAVETNPVASKINVDTVKIVSEGADKKAVESKIKVFKNNQTYQNIKEDKPLNSEETLRKTDTSLQKVEDVRKVINTGNANVISHKIQSADNITKTKDSKAGHQEDSQRKQKVASPLTQKKANVNLSKDRNSDINKQAKELIFVKKESQEQNKIDIERKAAVEEKDRKTSKTQEDIVNAVEVQGKVDAKKEISTSENKEVIVNEIKVQEKIKVDIGHKETNVGKEINCQTVEENQTSERDNIIRAENEDKIVKETIDESVKSAKDDQRIALVKHSEDKILDTSVCRDKVNGQVELETFCNKLEDPVSELIKFDSEESYSNMGEVTHVRVLTLNDGEHTNSTLYRIEKGWILQFRLGPSLFGRKVSLYCNYPSGKDGKSSEFNRNRYFLLPFRQDEGCNSADDTALFVEIIVNLAGSFHYYFVYENASEPGPQGSGYFLVDPVLSFPDENLPLNCVQCQTVLAKCLGPFSTWDNKLRVTKESGYNMIHFTPIQELGKSHSAYSLSAQLKLNPNFNDNNKKLTFSDIESFTQKMRTEWKVLSICDIVLNHTANETEWLQEHPESTYNCLNCPYMRPAYLLDAALHQFSMNVKKGVYETEGIPPEVCTEDHINSIRYALFTKVLPEIKLQEMFICNVGKLVSEFLDLARKHPSTAQIRNQEREIKLIRDPLYRRLSATVDLELALELYNVYRSDAFDEDTRLKRCGEEFKVKLDSLNRNVVDQLNRHLHAAVENCIAGIRYFRVQSDGPRFVEISVEKPLTSRYFTDYGNPKSIKEFEEVMYGPNSKYLMAHNGWVMDADPMKNFADSDSDVYIRRELIAWGDSVKLRFGDKPEDSPFLWNHMKEYVELTAKIFDGVRLDNCHSTPIPVAEYLLDCARRVRPDLYVVAELFTNSDHTDNIFVNRLGITSLIREAMSAWDSHEEGRLVYRYGGEPVGAFFQPYFRPLVPSVAHALFLDLTHDNPSPIEKRSVFDLLPSSALVNMACCASGSSRGYDELVTHHIHVVEERRQYTEWTNDVSLAKQNSKYVSFNSGIISAKRALNDLHYKLGKQNFSQVYVDQVDEDIVTVTRHCPDTHESVILVAFTAFRHPNMNAGVIQRSIKPLVVEGNLDEIILEATLCHDGVNQGGSKYSSPECFVKDGEWINGLFEYEVDIKQHIQLENSDVFEPGQTDNPNMTKLNFKNFKPGSVVAIKVSLQKNVEESIRKLRELLISFSKKTTPELQKIIKALDLNSLNRALYRCDQEERDDGHGFGAYNIPNFGSLVYCGLQGFMSLLSTIRPSNDLGHPMCGNLRDGNWMIDYIVQRLQVEDATKELGVWMENSFLHLKNIPRYLVPSYFDVLVTGVYMLLLDQCYASMSSFVKHGSTFVRALSLGSVQLAAVINSAPLPTLSPNLSPPQPPAKSVNGKMTQSCVTLSAGLPHFSTGYMRSWGRDTFIALRGLFILTGRFEEARYHILGYGACLRHGLIPNLLDGGRNSRFNCRDAIWWWLYCIKCYVEEAPNGVNFLSDKVSRIFPSDDSPALEPGVEDQPLYEVMQESLRTHFQGLRFRERNAGRQIDAHMSDNGFNNQIGIHPDTGFVFGGNESNCGTWMDKMGSSDKAGNRGKPATPRDGSAIELIGLSKAVISWLEKLYDEKAYPYQGVQRTSKTGTILSWTFKAWAEKIQNSFERHFWVDINKTNDETRSDLVNKRGIYKDCYGASQEWTDFQLRCNFPIAMVAAPELFNPKHAWVALQKAEKYLLGPLGMKTLDPEDWTYCGDYNNADDSNNFKTAQGFNYHQGPEWLWPIGFFLRAKLHFAKENGELVRTVASTKVILAKHFTELQSSIWRGLPELTNSNGTYCGDSCRTQAWSMSCILEVFHDLQRIESKQMSSKN